MKISDRVYGDVEFTEPVLIELINSPSLQRLKDIDQAGYLEPHFPGISHSRFEHSVGVCAILQRFGAPLAEQIAGLIHDVSHGAFSHCLDYVLQLPQPEQHAHQDNLFDEFVNKSEIPGILKKYNFDLQFILNDENFPLKEQPLPALCADRIDYFLREAVITKTIPSAEYFLEKLSVEEGQWVFVSFEIAYEYAKLFRTINTVYYSGLPSAVMFMTISSYLRYALRQEYIIESDLYTTDRLVLDTIAKYLPIDTELQRLWDRLNNKIAFRNDQANYESRICCKSRVIDPLCWHNNQLRTISDVDITWKIVLESESEPKCYYISFAS